MDEDKITDSQKMIRTAARFVAGESSRILHIVDALGYFLTNIKDDSDSDSLSEENTKAATEYCRKIAERVCDVSEWVDSAGSMLPTPFNKIANTTFTMGVNDHLIAEAVAAKEQVVNRFWDQLVDDQPYRRRDDENNWIEDSES